jgi:ATP-dependent RNA helicase DeaD
MKPVRPKREGRGKFDGPKGKFDGPRGKPRRRSGDDDFVPHHPAYEPLNTKDLARDLDGDQAPKRKSRSADAPEGERRKPRTRPAANAAPAKKKAGKKNKPSRAERKATKTKP